MGGMDERLHVLGEAGSAVADAGIDELIADAVIRTDARTHVAHVRADLLAQRGDFVDEGNLGRQHAVSGVFGHFRAADTHDDELFAAPGKGSVEVAHGGGRLFGRRTYDDPVGLHEIRNRVAFLEELGVRHHIEGNVLSTGGEGGGDKLADTVGGPDGHGGLVHDDERPTHVLADLAGHAFHKGKIAGAIGTRGRAHGDEGKFGVIQSVRKAGRKPQAAFLPVAADKVFEAGLENMDTPAVEQGHDFRVDVHTADVIAHFGETRRAHKTDVAGADNAYAHRCSFKTVRTGRRARWRRNRIRKRSPAISSTCNHPAAQRQLDFGPR